jgi:putative ABC transport system permease protein
MVFDVQGLPMTTRVASLREVDWRRVQPNFFVVFPTGVLEEAPAFHVLLTRVGSAGQSAALQRAVVQNFPNVSAIDLTLILQTLDSVFSKVSFVIRFMALFTVITGLLVLAGAILTGRYQRIRESILLRTLGASRAQILKIQAAEYACLGLLAALTGIVLALAASWALSAFVFKVRFVPSMLPLAMTAAIVSALTVLVGLFTCKGISNHPPLEILRSES